MAKEKKEPEKPSTAWQGTYGDMITLMLCFFVMLYDPTEIDITQLATITQSLQMNETESVNGGMSLSTGKRSDLGNTINSLPAIEKGRSLGLAKKKAVSLFAPDVKSNRITITSDERGLVISLAADNFFEEGSADLNIDETRETLLRLSDFFKDPELKNRRFRIEGHTDNIPIVHKLYTSNDVLSDYRALAVFNYLVEDAGVSPNNLKHSGRGEYSPIASNDTAEGRAQNRRVEIKIYNSYSNYN